MIRPLGADLAKVLPAEDVNGDRIALVDREEIFRLAWGAIRPVWSHFHALRWKENALPEAARMTRNEEAGAGRAETIATLNTEEGRQAFLECWWGAKEDGACVMWTAQKPEDVPYPTWSQIRTVAIWLRPEPDLMQCTYRFGAWQVTTTGLKALWDIGIRRLLWYPNPKLYQWLLDQGAGPRMQQAAEDDPYRTRMFAPETPETKATYYVDLSERPVTDDYMAWLRGDK